MPSMMRITTNAREYLGELRKIEGAMQRVTAATLTETAQAVTTRAERNIKCEMIVRTAYTTKSLRTYKASPSRPIARQDAVSGTVSEYLPIQDEGGTIKARKRRIAVPTNAVRGVNRRKRIPSRYRIDTMGSRAFILRPASPVKVLRRPALFLRTSKRRIVKVRDLGARDYRLKARRWHSEAVERYGNWDYMSRVFARQARRYLGSVAS